MSQPVPLVKVTIDGHEVEVPSGTTIYDAAQKIGIRIPLLCHREYMNPLAVCRVSAVDLDNPMGNSSCVSCGECMVSCPTGALVNRTVVNRVVDDGPKKKASAGPVAPDELIRLPLFEGISHAFLRFNENAVVRRRFK